MGRSGRGDELPSWARRHLDEHDEQDELVPSAPVPGPRRRHRARRGGADRMRGWGLAAVAIAAAAGVVPLAVTSLTDDRSDVRIPVVDTFPAVAPAALPPERTRLVPAPPRVSVVPAPEAPAITVRAEAPRAPAVAPGSRGVSRATVLTTAPADEPTTETAPPTTVTVVTPPPTPREGSGSPTPTTTPPDGSSTGDDQGDQGGQGDQGDQDGDQRPGGLLPGLVDTVDGAVNGLTGSVRR